MIDALVRVMARRCGLEDPDAFAAQPMDVRLGETFARAVTNALTFANASREDWLEANRRGTGRTTRMLLKALCALECGCSVEIVALDRKFARDLRERFLWLAADADASGSAEWPEAYFTWVGRLGDLDRPAADIRLVDHSAETAMGEVAR